jgi:HlyD family secretion protein
MDRKIEKKTTPLKKVLYSLGIGTLAVVVCLGLFSTTTKELNVQMERLLVDTVSQGTFQEFIPVDGTIQPMKTIYINSAEGGRVEERFVEDGAVLKKGDPILRLSNTDLQLDFMNKEAAFLDQMNNMRNTRLSLDQSLLQLSSQFLDVDHAYIEKKREYLRTKKLKESGSISIAEFEKSEDEFNYLTNKRKLIAQTIKKDSVVKLVQIKQMESNINLIQRNLEMVRQSLDNLIVKAPIDGQLTSLNAEVGESKQKGENLGQIDNLEGFKVRANVDEHYVSRVFIGQQSECTIDGIVYKLTTKKVYPKVTNGQFQVDMTFNSVVPPQLRQGQSLQLKLALGDRAQALLLQRGGFYQKTGGNWVYVINGKQAEKREVKLGRQNPDYYEILEGLQKGDRVIVSAYDVFGEADKLQIK